MEHNPKFSAKPIGAIGAIGLMFKEPENLYFKRILVDRESGEGVSIKMR